MRLCFLLLQCVYICVCLASLKFSSANKVTSFVIGSSVRSVYWTRCCYVSIVQIIIWRSLSVYVVTLSIILKTTLGNLILSQIWCDSFRIHTSKLDNLFTYCPRIWHIKRPIITTKSLYLSVYCISVWFWIFHLSKCFIYMSFFWFL